MGRRLLAAAAILLAACLPAEVQWQVTDSRFRGVRIEVVQPGPYASLLKVPRDRRRATVLPLDTVELEWFVAAPPGVEVPPPIWILCPEGCFQLDVTTGVLLDTLADLTDCASPLPLGAPSPCRLGDGHRIRVTLGGAHTITGQSLELLLVGARHQALSPATCLERLRTQPRDELKSCLVGVWRPKFGPDWAMLPFDPAADAIPPEVLAQEADTNPGIRSFVVTRELGSERQEIVVEPGETVGVRPGERVTVKARLARGSKQVYLESSGGDKDIPWSGRLNERTESLEFRAWFSAVVAGFDRDYNDWENGPITWTVPEEFESTILWVDLRDNRSGRAFAELFFVVEDDP